MSSTTLYYQEDINKSILKAIRVCGQKPKQDQDPYNNLRTLSAYEDLLKNADYIPVEAVEEFVNKHRKI